MLREEGKQNLRHVIAAVAVLVLAVFLRFWELGDVPQGLHQDEANIGYESYVLATYGVDRDLNPWPVYPITYGSGGGSPLMIYINVVTTKLFGSSVMVLRALVAVFGVATVVLFGVLCGRGRLVGMLVLAVCPWHIMLSRWSLDANTVPFWEVLLLLLVIRGARTGKTRDWCLAAGLAALNLYAYGSANVVIPIFLVTGVVYCLCTRVLKPGQLLPAAAAFVIVAFPLIVFYAVNYLGLPEIRTAHFTVNRFTNNRLAEVFIFHEENIPWALRQNLLTLLQEFTIGFEDRIYTCHVPGYATMYRFTFPLTLFGMYCSWKRMLQKDENGKRTFCPEALVHCMLLGASILHLIIKPEIQRLVYMYVPLAFFQAKGIVELYRRKKAAGYVAAIVLLVGCMFFTRVYHGRYNESTEEWLAFMPGFTEATLNAKAIADLGEDVTIYHTRENVTSLYQIALYAHRVSPYDYQETLTYNDRNPYYRSTESFLNFVFALPEDTGAQELDPSRYPGDVFVMNTYETGVFDDDTWGKETFGRYTVVYPRGLTE